MIEYGRRFSAFFYQKEFRATLPEPAALGSADPAVAATALDVIAHAIELRQTSTFDGDGVGVVIKSYLDCRDDVNGKVFAYLRRVLGQGKGPTVATLLALLPLAHLQLAAALLRYHWGQNRQVRLAKAS